MSIQNVKLLNSKLLQTLKMYLKLRTLLDIVYFPKLPERLGSRLFETQTPSLSLLSESVTDVLSK